MKRTEFKELEIIAFLSKFSFSHVHGEKHSEAVCVMEDVCR